MSAGADESRNVLESLDGSMVLANGKNSALVDIQAGFDGSDLDDENTWIVQLQDRLEDAKDALMENEYVAKAYSGGEKAYDLSSRLWSFSKKAVWIIGTSALVLVVPLLYEMDKEINLTNSSEAVQPGQTQPSTGPAPPAAAAESK